jgi:hypothetical protein
MVAGLLKEKKASLFHSILFPEQPEKAQPSEE